MADPTNPVGDELDLKPNGTARIGMGGTFVSLRRPTFGQFRKLKELWAGVAGQEKTITDAANGVPVPERPASWRMDYEMALATVFIGWSLEALRLLGTSTDLPAEDDLPPWMATSAFGLALFDHWVTVPLAASSR